ncbi:MAG: cell division protein ZapA [Bacteroidota bacterium]|nr:cell division protein ZapA [Candidatus Kapabacteria bacterium]MCS7302473.1 cell division protein ZapA [Candidatus Kapabacteria bacterium]MCX7936363.1 cell division protein ZapA [Chlorobiota bacterium]MDW8074356.1 cell division protein ZapA [Bacteroidota bacterium]MDW8271168.1 cell division protein ZapA [Bacteroidota bacterium]
MTTVTVTIGGRQLRLRCEDEQRTLKAAAEVENVFRALQHESSDQSTPILTLLAALNIAERHDAAREQYKATLEYVLEQLRAMSIYADDIIRQTVELAAG